jgi:hypothetical protein
VPGADGYPRVAEKAVLACARMRVTHRTRVWLITAFFALVYATLALFALEAFPLSGDEHSYLLQGQIFARGRLSVPAPPNAQLFWVDHVVIDDTVRSKYPLGWPALLALGWLVHAPWVINPILAALTLPLVYAIGGALHGAAAGFVAMLLLGFAPIFALNAASFYSHVPALYAGALYVVGLVKSFVLKKLGWASVAGLGLGLMFLIRPADAAAYGVASLAFYGSPRVLLACGLPAALVAGLTLPYQAVQFGSPWRSGYVAFNPIGRALFGYPDPTLPSTKFILSPTTQWWHLGSFVQLAEWLVPGTLALALVHWLLTAERGPVRWFFILLAVLPSLALLPLPDIAGDTYGPRYLFPVLLPLAVAAGASWVRLEPWVSAHPSLVGVQTRLRTRVFVVILAALLACAVVRSGMYLERAHVEIGRRSRLYRQVEELGLAHAVVIVTEERSTFWARNLADFEGPVIYVSAWGRTDEEVARLFPDRVAYSALRPPGRFEWTIVRVPSTMK